MSAHVSQPSFQYVGILNGVVYRIDPSSGRSAEPMFGSQPIKKWSERLGDEAPTHVRLALQTVYAEAPTVTPAVAEDVPEERIAAPSNLFPRSGAEPLRAGHPDLWALIVAGTCLEGSEYSPL